jgi:tricorn protease
VHPDIEVESDPRALLSGRDPQLERAVEELLRRLAEHPVRLPRKPADPVKTP